MIKKTYCIFTFHLIFLSLYIINLLESNYLESFKFIYQSFGFLYITFLSGFLFIKIITKEKLEISKNLLLSLAASIFFLMFLGYVANLSLPIIGIEQPLSKAYLFSIVFVLSILLSIVYLKSHNNFKDYFSLKISKYLSDKFLIFALLFPIIPFIGHYYQNYYKDNIFNTFLILLILFYLIIYITISIKKSDNEDIIIYLLSLGLLLHYSLISDFIFGYDTHFEYFTANQVINNGIWDPLKVVFATNQMLSTTILPAFYVQLLGIDLTHFIKIIYPIIFAFVPLGLYLLFRKISNQQIAFLSVIFFIFQITFFTQLIMNVKQGIAEIYFIVILILIFDNSIGKLLKSIFFVLTSFSIVVSHYGVSYFVAGYLALYIMIKHILGKTTNINTKNKFFSISDSKVILFIVILGTWGLYVAVSSSNGFLEMFKDIFNSIYIDFFSPALRNPTILSAVGYNEQKFELLRKTNANLIRFSFFCIIIGAIKLIYYNIRHAKNKNYDLMIFIFISLVILLISIILPFFSQAMQMTRIYHITLFILSICFIYGFFELFKFLRKTILFTLNINCKSCIKILAVYLIVFLLFQTGLIQYFFQQSSSAAISLQSQDPIALNGAYTHSEEVYSARWLYDNKGSYDIYSDQIASQHVLTSYGNLFHNRPYLTKQKKTGYAYLRYINIEYGVIPSVSAYEFITIKLEDAIDFPKSNKIYSNNKSDIYLMQD